MRTATTIEAASGKNAVEFAVEAEKLGLDICWVAEAWGADAASPLGYLAARTQTMRLGSGVFQLCTRSPGLHLPAPLDLGPPVRRAVPARPGRLRAAGHRGTARRRVRPPAGPDAGDG